MHKQNPTKFIPMFQSKYIKYAAWSVLAVTMIAFVMMRQDTVKLQAEKLLQINQQYVSLEERATAFQMENSRLADENQALLAENTRLKDTIAMLRSELTSLHSLFSQQKMTIAQLEKTMLTNKLKIQKLQAEIQRIKNDSPADIEQKKDKVEQIMEIQNETMKMEQTRENVYAEMGSTESGIVIKELEELRMKQIDLIRNNTTINYRQVECRQTRSGKPISKIEEDGTNWIFTTIIFDMQNPEQGRLMEEVFRIKLIDTDTGMELPYLESNPSFSKAQVETKGFTFNYRENPVKTLYINLQAKPGKNYSARMYYVNDDQEYIIAGSEVKVITNGMVVGM
jgi:predicted RNase H-like nuclease (RuvC/YqgF family)